MGEMMGIDIPSRTGIELTVQIPVDASKPGGFFAALELTPEMIKRYECLDCGFVTLFLIDIELHQANQALHHSRWQRIKRRWHLFADARKFRGGGTHK